MSTITKFNIFYCNHMFHSHSILLGLPSQPLLPSSLSYITLQSQMNPNECVCVKIWRVFHIQDRKYRFEINFYSVCLINDYSVFNYCRPTYLFVYGIAECASISLECTKVKLLLIKNFEHQNKNID